jgi:hypothetical protein
MKGPHELRESVRAHSLMRSGLTQRSLPALAPDVVYII